MLGARYGAGLPGAPRGCGAAATLVHACVCARVCVCMCVRVCARSALQSCSGVVMLAENEAGGGEVIVLPLPAQSLCEVAFKELFNFF